METLGFTIAELCVSVSLADRGLMGMAQELPEVSVWSIRLLGTLCAFGTAQPFPLLLTGSGHPCQAGAVPSSGQAAGGAPGQGDRKAHSSGTWARGQEGTQLQCRTCAGTSISVSHWMPLQWG